MTDKIVIQARSVAVHAHRSTNHLYDGQPYERHLEMVVGYVERFQNLVETDKYTVMAAAWMHDTIEDCRLTYNDVKNALGEEVAELVYALTNEKGRNRKQRANDKYYAGIKAVKDAPFLKICDRLANIEYSRNTNSKMIKAYRKEADSFRANLYCERLKDMFTEMDLLLYQSSEK